MVKCCGVRSLFVAGFWTCGRRSPRSFIIIVVVVRAQGDARDESESGWGTSAGVPVVCRCRCVRRSVRPSICSVRHQGHLIRHVCVGHSVRAATTMRQPTLSTVERVRAECTNSPMNAHERTSTRATECGVGDDTAHWQTDPWCDHISARFGCFCLLFIRFGSVRFCLLLLLARGLADKCHPFAGWRRRNKSWTDSKSVLCCCWWLWC